MIWKCYLGFANRAVKILVVSLAFLDFERCDCSGGGILPPNEKKHIFWSMEMQIEVAVVIFAVHSFIAAENKN